VLQFGDSVFYIRAAAVIAPDLLRSGIATGDKDTESVAGHVDQSAAHAVATFAQLLANEATLHTPTEQFQPNLAYGIVGVQYCPLLHALGHAFHPGSQHLLLRIFRPRSSSLRENPLASSSATASH
jgi:hypothetical protein